MATALRTIICPHCHTETETTGRFCPECGARLDLPDNGTRGTNSPPVMNGNASMPAASITEPMVTPNALTPPPSPFLAPDDLSSAPPLESTPAWETAPQPVILPQTDPARVEPDTLMAIDLSPEQWMQVLTALGHYAGVLRNLNLETERAEVLETYRA